MSDIINYNLSLIEEINTPDGPKSDGTLIPISAASGAIFAAKQFPLEPFGGGVNTTLLRDGVKNTKTATARRTWAVGGEDGKDETAQETEPIDTEFKNDILDNEEGIYSEFEITDANKGKQPEPTDTVVFDDTIVKVVDMENEYEKSTAGDIVYDEFNLSEFNKGKQPDPTEAVVFDDTVVKVVDMDNEYQKSTAGDIVYDEFNLSEFNKGKQPDPTEAVVFDDPTVPVLDMENEYEKISAANVIYEDFEVNSANKGKQPDPTEEVVFNNPTVSVLDMENEYEKTTAENVLYNEFEVNSINKGKQPESTNAPVFDNPIVPVLDMDNEYEKSTARNVLYNEYEVTDANKGKDDSVNIADFSPFLSSAFASIPYQDGELSYDSAVDKLNIKGQSSNLGSMHVYPVNPSTEGGISAKYIIPFEFNAKISESGRSAKFESSSLLSRIGDIHSYIKTDAMSVQMTTNYQVLSVNDTENSAIPANLTGDHNRVGSWMKEFHLRNIQSIEMAYRGLVFPQSNKEAGSYFRPPLIKIIFGATGVADGATVGSDIVPFNSLLTYPYKIGSTTKVYHKSFIVSKVDIKKDWETMPIIMNKQNDGIIDLQGFTVTLDLLEVDPMYIGVLPAFEDFYSLVKGVS